VQFLPVVRGNNCVPENNEGGSQNCNQQLPDLQGPAAGGPFGNRSASVRNRGDSHD
jgi:hypothetical protein